MTTIQATVNPRLLTKAARFFTGSVPGRIIEVLQNARRGGATHVEITNHDGVVTVRDNGRGIGDFAQLLDMGGSGWDDDTEAAEDPASVGLFCLAPRKVMIRSRGCMAVGKPADTESLAWTLRVFVTPEAERRLQPSEIWHHFGGWSDGGDCYETQETQFTEQLEEFWARLLGPPAGPG